MPDLALSLEEDQVGAVILGDYTELREGDEVKRTGKILSVPVGDAMIGRVVNALGVPIDDKGPIATTRDAIRSNAWRPASSTARECASPWPPGSRPSTP